MASYETTLIVAVLVTATLSACSTAPRSGGAPRPQVFYQAHRGGLREVPENTMVAFRHAWRCPGAVPEVDVRTTKDGVMVCMHDETPARTTNAPGALKDRPVSQIVFEELRQWDAGVRFDRKYAGEKVPALREVFDEMRGRPERQIYLDLKGVDLEALVALIEEYGLNDRVIFVHGAPAMCIRLSGLFPGARTMTWLSGDPDTIRTRFETLAAGGFEGISQIQLHLKTTKPIGDIEYVFDDAFLRAAFEKAQAAGAELQLRPFRFDTESLQGLVDTGVRWFVTDEPRRFAETLAQK